MSKWAPELADTFLWGEGTNCAAYREQYWTYGTSVFITTAAADAADAAATVLFSQHFKQ